MPIFDSMTAVQLAALSGIATIERDFANFVKNYKRAFDFVWRNPDYTPQQILDGVGTRATTLFLKSGATRDYLLSIDPDCLPPEYQAPLQEPTFNPDGTVTLAA
jgi:hypothetical protein